MIDTKELARIAEALREPRRSFHAGDCQNCDESLKALAAEAMDAALSRIAELERGLEDVVNPLGAIQRDAEAKGHRLSASAYSIANSLSFVQDVARRALGPRLLSPEEPKT